jgi:ribosomal protein L21E
MANETRNMYLALMREQRYDGRSPVEPFLKSFEVLKNVLGDIDPSFDNLIIKIIFQSTFRDAENPPKIGLDGER